MYLKQNVVGGVVCPCGGEFAEDGGLIEPAGVKKLEPDQQWRVYETFLTRMSSRRPD